MSVRRRGITRRWFCRWAVVVTLAAAPASAVLGADTEPPAKTDSPAATAPPAAPKAPADPPAMPTDAELFRETGIPPSSVGYAVVDLATGKTVAARAPATAFIPASAIKVPTTVAALNILGPEYHFETRLLVTGQVKDGVLDGDVFLKGGGDPVLTSDDLAPLAERLKTMGIHRITGGLFYDESFLPTVQIIDPLQEEEAAYNPGVGALSLNFNRVRLSWKKTRKGKRLNGFRWLVESHTRRITVPVDFLRITLAPRGTRMPKYLVYRNGENGPEWILSPRVRRKGKIWLPIKRPGFHAAVVFRKLAAAHGVALPPPVAMATPSAARPVAIHRSPPLAEITKRVLHFSNNMAAELIGMVAARSLTNKPETIPLSAAVLAERIKAIAPEADWANYHLDNHSGLTRKTRITPAQMIAVLRFADRQRYGGATYESLLRKYRLKKSGGPEPPHVEILAKTGTIDYARSVAGFLTTRSKRRLAFALFISDYRTRVAYGAARTRRSYRIPRLRRWMLRAYKLQQAMLRKWIAQH